MTSYWPHASLIRGRSKPPERRKQYSPGQRPGNTVAMSAEALKGRNSRPQAPCASASPKLPSRVLLSMPPFQGLSRSSMYSQGVALGCTMHAFQAGSAAASQMRIRNSEGRRTPKEGRHD